MKSEKKEGCTLSYLIEDMKNVLKVHGDIEVAIFLGTQKGLSCVPIEMTATLGPDDKSQVYNFIFQKEVADFITNNCGNQKPGKVYKKGKEVKIK